MNKCTVVIPNPKQDKEIVLPPSISQQIAALVIEHWNLIGEHGFCVFFDEGFEPRNV